MNYDRGIRGGDFFCGAVAQMVCVRVASDNPAHTTIFYGFRTFRPHRMVSR